MPPSPAIDPRRGLVRNPAAPADLLLHLLATDPLTVTKALPDRRAVLPRAVQEAMLHHPSGSVRRALARQRYLDPDVRERLLADPDWLVMIAAFGDVDQEPLSDDAVTAVLTRIAADEPDQLLYPNEAWQQLDDAAAYGLSRLSAIHPDPRIRLQAIDVALHRDDPDPGVRAASAARAAEQARPIPLEEIEALARDRLWSWTLITGTLSRAVIDACLVADDRDALRYLAGNPGLPPGELLRHPDAEIRGRLAQREDLTREQALILAAAPEVAVRTAVSVHPALTEDDRAGIDIEPGAIGPYSAFSAGPRAQRVSHEEAVRRARSVNPLLRRVAAGRRDLPADLVALLADDADDGVRHRLATCHPDAPPALLLRRYLESDLDRARLRGLPRFPVDGLAAFAGHADPDVRRLVALDPAAAPELVEELLEDPDPGVRTAMAACPRLPVARIVALLDDPDLAGHAAANPALPPGRMWVIGSAG